MGASKSLDTTSLNGATELIQRLPHLSQSVILKMLSTARTRPLLMDTHGAPWTGGSTTTTPSTANQCPAPKSSSTSIPRSPSTPVVQIQCAELVLLLSLIQVVLESRWILAPASPMIATQLSCQAS